MVAFVEWQLQPLCLGAPNPLVALLQAKSSGRLTLHL